MKITDLLTIDTMIIHLKAAEKKEAIKELSEKVNEAGKVNNLNAFQDALFEREKVSTTGIGDGVAIPHAKSNAVTEPVIAFGRSLNGVEFEALDGKPSHLFFMIAFPEQAKNGHLEALSKLSTYLLDEAFRIKLMKAESAEEIVSVIKDKEERVSANESISNETSGQKGKLVAVTACPTGIAHTYMAAESLKEKAKEMGYDIKVQTNGSSGVKNRLSQQDIEEAKGVIIAASTKVDLSPFHGKRVVQAPVTDGIRHAEKLIQQAINENTPLYTRSETGGSKENDGQTKEKTGFYKHLMNGVSNMLPLVVGGGLLIALSFIIDINGNNPVAKLFMNIGGNHAFKLLIPVLAGFIAMSIADRPGLAPGFVGGFMAYDSGAGFLGGLIAGFLAGYIVQFLKKAFQGLPQVLDGLKPVLLYPLFGLLLTGAAMYFIDYPLEGLNSWLKVSLSSLGTGNAVLLGIIVGGMMAVDMGGPINKASYTFGLALLEAGNYGPMAAIMAGGMVPPLGMALATTLFKRKFSKQEREAGKTAYVLGASFITEGAIPFAAADPVRVIPASVAGSALAGGLSMLFKNASHAPHGGIFVIFAVDHPLLYVAAITAGAFLTAILVGVFKKA